MEIPLRSCQFQLDHGNSNWIVEIPIGSWKSQLDRGNSNKFLIRNSKNSNNIHRININSYFHLVSLQSLKFSSLSHNSRAMTQVFLPAISIHTHLAYYQLPYTDSLKRNKAQLNRDLNDIVRSTTQLTLSLAFNEVFIACSVPYFVHFKLASTR